MSHLDETFSQYAEAFLGNMIGEGDIPLRKKLNSLALDYSPISLKEVDRYLTLLYTNGVDTTSIEYKNVVVWCGAYIGEVIRRNAFIEYHWVHYEDNMKNKDPSLKILMPYTLGTHALLVDAGSGYTTMPINKVARFLDEGEANNIHFYASGDISRKKPQGPTSEMSKKGDPTTKPWWKFW